MVQLGGAGSTTVETSQDQISLLHELSERKCHHEYPAAEDCQSRPLDVDQKKLIDTLLIQQREVLKELRDHRKGLELSQAARDEIGDLVRSSIKQYLQAAPLPLRGKDPRKGHEKNPKNPRRRRKRTRSEKFDRDSPSESATGHGSNSPPFGSPPSGTWCDDKTTIVRQRVEQEPEHMDVSLDGYWLPSLSNDNDEARGLWAEPAAVAPADAHRRSEARNQAGGRPSCRPATVASQVPRKSQARRTIPRSLGCKEVTAGRCKYFGGVSVRRRVEHTRRAKPAVRRGDPTGSAGGSSTPTDKNDLARGTTRVDREPPSEPVLSTLHEVKSFVDDSMKRRSNSDNGDGDGDGNVDGNGNGDGNGSSINSNHRSNNDRSEENGRNSRNGEMSERQGYKASSGKPVGGEHRNKVVTAICPNIAAMLERSRALVARAKASCGDAVRSTKRDSSRIAAGVAASTADGEGEQASSIFFPVILPCSSENNCPNPQDEVPQTSATRSREQPEVQDDPKVPCGGDSCAEACQRGEGSDRVGALGVLGEEPSEGTRQQAVPGCRGDGARASVPNPQMLPDAVAALGSRTPTQGSASRLRPATAVQKPHGDCATLEETARPGTALVRNSHGVLAREHAGGVAGRQAEGGRACVGNPAKVDSEWENEIAKNILSLYQTKLKDELEKKRGSGGQAAEDPRSRRYPMPEEKACEIDRRDERSTSACPVGGSRGGRRWDGDECTTRNSSPGKCRPVTAEAHLDVRGGTHRTLGPGSRPRVLGYTAGEAGPGGRHVDQRPATVPTSTELGGHKAIKLQRSGATGPTMGRGGFRGSKIISVPTRGGGEAVVVVPKRPTPIWFAGSGTIQAEWSALPGGARVVRDLESLEEHGRYAKYVAVVEGLLAAHLRADDQRGPTELVKRLWRQLVVTCTAFGARCVETKRFAKALELLKRAGVLMSREVLDRRAASELKAFVSDAYGLYYLRRGKSSAALDYVQKAMRVHVYMQDWGHVTKCHLHSGVILSRLNRHDEALRCLGQVLSIVEEGKFDVGGNSPQKLCLVAICYHNIAVEQLILGHAGEACMSSQNARRLARLCLSYSNRWLHSFEGTHKLALAELARSLPFPLAGSRSGDTGVGASGSGLAARGRRTTSGGVSAAEIKDDEEAISRRHFLERLIEDLFT